LGKTEGFAAQGVPRGLAISSFRSKADRPERLREAEVERLARVVRGSVRRRHRLRVTIGLSLKPRRRAHEPRFTP
jgi:hypothetical protein